MSIRTFVGGVGVGAALIYLFDPKEGSRRRALARDYAQRGVHGAGQALQDWKNGLQQRVGGLLSGRHDEAAALESQSDDDVDVEESETDASVEQRVRAAVARLCTHPAAVEVVVQDGRVELEGTILSSERDPLIAHLRTLEGVTDVGDYLDEVEPSEVQPTLQG